ncbi:Ras domain containing protein [Trichuris trichiura]|uniref:Ras domain containing protein n=1 Tax=Trichuris trichiura TaxID=36087 RepID=A0A077ZD94_TRITR|nr:Ras domain containing protein [Trichuris trichiura]
MPEQSNDYKVAIYGAGGVGKSSIIMRFVKGSFNENYVPTIEDTYRQVISCNKNNVCTLHITDSTGSHQFPAMQRLSVSKGNAFILVYAVTNRQSFEELRHIYEFIKTVRTEDIAELPIMIVGNKIDEEGQREIPPDSAKSLASNWKCGYIETSAKNNINIKELFQELLSMDRRRKLSLTMDEIRKPEMKSKKCCCLC